jgi:hypothetical protein
MRYAALLRLSLGSLERQFSTWGIINVVLYMFSTLEDTAAISVAENPLHSTCASIAVRLQAVHMDSYNTQSATDPSMGCG